MINWGNVPVGAVLPFPFDSFAGSTGASITLTGLAATDVEIYKGTSMTQRSSDNGVALMDTDGIDIDSRTGIHGFSIDTGDDTDAGFYAVGSYCWVVVDAVTIDSQAVRFLAGTFRLMAAEGVAGVPDVNTTHVADTAQTAGDLKASLNTIDDFVDTEVAAIKAKTDNLPADPADASDIAALLDTIDNFVDTEVAAIKAKTDNLPDDPADASVVAGLIAAAEAKIDIVDTVVDAIKAVTDLLTAAQAEPTGVPAADATPLIKLGVLFMALRNRIDITSAKKTFYDDGGAGEWEKDLSDDGTTYSESEGNAI